MILWWNLTNETDETDETNITDETDVLNQIIVGSVYLWLVSQIMKMKNENVPWRKSQSWALAVHSHSERRFRGGDVKSGTRDHLREKETLIIGNPDKMKSW